MEQDVLSKYRSWTTRAVQGRVQRRPVTLCTLLIFQEYQLKTETYLIFTSDRMKHPG
jgi:hypothetical protein